MGDGSSQATILAWYLSGLSKMRFPQFRGPIELFLERGWQIETIDSIGPLGVELRGIREGTREKPHVVLLGGGLKEPGTSCWELVPILIEEGIARVIPFSTSPDVNEAMLKSLSGLPNVEVFNLFGSELITGLTRSEALDHVLGELEAAIHPRDPRIEVR